MVVDAPALMGKASPWETDTRAEDLSSPLQGLLGRGGYKAGWGRNALEGSKWPPGRPRGVKGSGVDKQGLVLPI